MSQITTVLTTATTLFGAVVVLSVSVFGFIKGREWFRNMDSTFSSDKEQMDTAWHNQFGNH